MMLYRLIFAMPLILMLSSRCHGDTPIERIVSTEVARAMKVWHIPGVAVVIVRDDKVVLAAGYGVKAVGRIGAVTADTLFPLGSCGKAFTTATMAILVDEKKLHWDDRVGKHLPWFHLSDPLADREVRLRDLMCHRTGVGNNNALFYRAPWKAEELVRRIGKVPLAKPFRTAFQYQSTMFTAAGLAAAAADGRSWADMIRKRLLDPLGMKDTRLDTASTLAMPDVAVGHQLDRAEEPEIMPRYAQEPDPAGSIHSSAKDMGRWLRFHLSGGLAGGKRLVSEEALAETQTPQMVMPMTAVQRRLFPDTVQMSYGMGWVIYDNRGMKWIAHGGAIDGFRTQIVLVPSRKLGVAVMCNLHQTAMNIALANTLVERLLGLPKRDWHVLYRAHLERLRAAAIEREKARQERKIYGTRPSRELAAYTGTYEHPAYGIAKIEMRGGRLVFRWRDTEAVLQHFHYDTFTGQAEVVGTADVTFALDSRGTVERFSISGNLGIEFRRVPKGATERK